jgi:hypothetical protein
MLRDVRAPLNRTRQAENVDLVEEAIQLHLKIVSQPVSPVYGSKETQRLLSVLDHRL